MSDIVSVSMNEQGKGTLKNLLMVICLGKIIGGPFCNASKIEEYSKSTPMFLENSEFLDNIFMWAY